MNDEEKRQLLKRIRSLEAEKSELQRISEATIQRLEKEVADLRKKQNTCFVCGNEANALLFCGESCKERIVQ